MRILQYSTDNEHMLEHTAEQFGVDKEKLWSMYLATMRANYEQDLWDIAKENKEELRGDYED